MNLETGSKLNNLDVAKLASPEIGDSLQITPFSPDSRILFSVTNNINQLEKAVSRSSRIVLVVSGASAAGKDSLVDGLKTKYGDVFERVKTCTTRQEIRPDEVNEDPYIRMSPENFEAALARGEFLEHAQYGDIKVGTNRKIIESVLKGGKIPVFRIDPQGARSLLEFWQDQDPVFKNCLMIYLNVVPENWRQLARRLLGRDVFSKDRKSRPQARGKAKVRWSQIKKDIGLMNLAHLVLVNEKGQLEQSVTEVKRLVDYYKRKLENGKAVKTQE